MKEVTLTWKEHHNNLCGMFEKLLEEGALVDCTLAAEGRYVNVHKTILCAVSPYFELIFSQEGENNPIVILTDIKFQELEAMIHFIYHGNVYVPEEYLEDFVCAAESLQIKGLGRDYIQNQKRNGTAMTYAKDFPTHVSPIPLNLHHQVNIVCGNENCGTATPSSLEAVDDVMDFEGHSAVSSQTDPFNLCRINQCSTSAKLVDNSISSRLSHGENELNSIYTSDPLCLESWIKREPTSEEEVLKVEFVECKEECVEEDSYQCFSLSETTCNSTSSSTLVAAGELQKDPLGSKTFNQSTSSVGQFDKAGQDSLGPVSSKLLQAKGKDILYLSTLPSTRCIDKDLEINTEDVKPRIEFVESCKVFDTEETAFDSELYTSETMGAEARDVEVEDAKMELLSEVEVKLEVKGKEGDEVAEGAPSLGSVECGKVFKDASQLNVHARTFACHLCGKAFSRPSTLKAHLRIHTGERPYACEECGKAFVDSSSLTKHKRTHTGERPFACRTCRKTFSTAWMLKDHLRIHTGERLIACHLCGKDFKHPSLLTRHLRTHTGERPFVCDVCGKDFQTKEHLTLHLRIHTGERPFTCEVCGKAFRTKAQLTLHLRTHTGERPFTCDVCGKDFLAKAHLTLHLRIHTGERPFACDVCGKHFRMKAHLEVHLRTHTGERPFACRLCDKGFSRSSTLKIHLLTHTGERPFACHTCGKTFVESRSLAKHRRTHTGHRRCSELLC